MSSSDNGISISDQFLTSRGQVFTNGIGGVGGATVMTALAEPALPTGALDVLTTSQSVDDTGARHGQVGTDERRLHGRLRDDPARRFHGRARRSTPARTS